MDKKPSIEAIATRLVNLKGRLSVEGFLREYGEDILPARRGRLSYFSRSLRDAWDRKRSYQPSFCEAIIEDIFFDTTIKLVNGKPYHVQSDSDPLSYPAFRARLGSSQPVFVRRDLIDDIAQAILKASAHGLLRTCRGHRRGWVCSTPLLVADEKRRVYCYMRCGDEAKSRAKLRWWRENKSAKARGRTRRRRTA